MKLSHSAAACEDKHIRYESGSLGDIMREGVGDDQMGQSEAVRRRVIAMIFLD